MRTPPRPRSPSPAPVRDERIEIRQRQAKHMSTVLSILDTDILFKWYP